MTAHRDPDVVVAAWLDAGPSDLPDATRRAILSALPTTSQARRGLLAPGRRFLMSTPTRLAGFALVAIVAIGGAIYILNPRSDTGVPVATPSPSPIVTPTPALPSPTATPAPTPFPTVNPDTATWTAYTSGRYGYSLAYPSGWRVAPASLLGEVPGSRFEFWSSSGDAADRFINPFKPRDLQEHLTAMATEVPAGMTDAAWIDAWETLPDGFTLDSTDCLTTAAEMPAVTISGHEGRISTKCETAAFLFVDGWMYLFSVESDEALFRAFLSTVQLPAPVPSPS